MGKPACASREFHTGVMGGDQHAVPGVKVLDQGADLHDLGAALVAQGEIFALAERAFKERVHVRGAHGDRQRPADRVQRPGAGLALLHPGAAADLLHCVGLHRVKTPVLPAPFCRANSF